MRNGAQFGFGLQLESELAVPGAVCGHRDAASRSVRIELLGPCEPPQEPGFARAAEAIVYNHPCGRFTCEKDRIGIEPGAQASAQDLGELLVANALPALLWQQGAFMLHAACVRFPDGPCVAIAGHSGAGKSRLAAMLVGAGAELIGDDSLALQVADQGIQAKGLPGGWFERSRDGQSREFMRVPSGPARGVCLLDLLLIIGGEDGPMRGLKPVEALEQLMQHRHRPQVPLLLQRQGRVLVQAAQIARRLPLVRLDVQPLLSSDPAAIGAHLCDLARQGGYVS